MYVFMFYSGLGSLSVQELAGSLGPFPSCISFGVFQELQSCLTTDIQKLFTKEQEAALSPEDLEVAGTYLRQLQS